MALPGGDGGPRHVGGGADGRGAAAQVRAHGEGPGQGVQVGPHGGRQGGDHRHHGGGKGMLSTKAEATPESHRMIPIIRVWFPR